MKKVFVVSGLIFAVFVAAISVIDLVLVAPMAIPAQAAVISFCENNKTGAVAFAPPSGQCPKSATLVQINSIGVPGPQGPQGPQGPDWCNRRNRGHRSDGTSRGNGSDRSNRASRPNRTIRSNGTSWSNGSDRSNRASRPNRTNWTTRTCWRRYWGRTSLLAVLCTAGVVWYLRADGVDPVEQEAQWPVPRDGRLVSLAVNPYDNSELNGKVLIKVRVNGSDTALQIAVPPNSTAVETFKTTVPVLAGDLMSLQVDTRAASSAGYCCASIIYEFIAN